MMTQTTRDGIAAPAREVDAGPVRRIFRCIAEGAGDDPGSGQTMAILQGGRLRAIVHRRDGRTVSVVRVGDDA